ncbi:MAG: hypothetical protein JSU73_00430 [candidate division WOR-3 bacterium]|nr:MAG: hypothetical protein JSU73_00430 [candidate division WOR-3 bacterium]
MTGFGIGVVIQMSLLFILVHGLALLAPAVLVRHLILPLMGLGLPGFVVGVMLLPAVFVLVLVSAVLCSGAASRVFRLRYSGEHPLDLSVPDVRRWLLSLTIYLPTAVVLDFFHLYQLKTMHVQLFGGKVGKGVVMGALVMDPGLLTVGDGTVTGGFATILGHAVEHGRIRFAPVRIGRECGVGTRATIIAGGVLEDGALLGAQSFLPKGGVVPAGKTYGGVPAREIATRAR